MTSIQLTAEEVEILADLLDTTLSDLRVEIGDTDRIEYKDMLKRRKAILTRIKDALKTPSESARTES